MITKQDLQEAIAECEGQRNPNANTCIKLAAFYTIKDNLFPEDDKTSYSFAAPPMVAPESKTVEYESDTEFSEAIKGMPVESVLTQVDELMSTLRVINPRLYDGVMRRLAD